jgi:sporulation protein YlmC with PRC-barrel domain
MDANDMKGLAVVTIAEADKLGRVEDVLFRSQPLEAVALRVATETGTRVVGMHSVSSIGQDAITTDTEASATDGESDFRHQELQGLEQLGKLKVVDRSGTYLGHITRVELEPSSGKVRSLDIRKGDVLGLGGDSITIANDKVVAVGPDLVTVSGTGTSGTSTSRPPTRS